MALTRKAWLEVIDGFGLQEVPRGLRGGLQCCMCGSNWPGKLWTDRSLENKDGTVAGAIKMINGLRSNCYCRYHAESMFGPREEE